MIEIIFQKSEDAKNFQKILREQEESLLLHERDILLVEDQHIAIKIKDHWMTVVQKAFFSYIMFIKQYEWARSILKDRFFYEDEQEQEQILEILTSVLEGQHQDLLAVVDIENVQSLAEIIEQLFAERVSFSYDSFVRFRLRSYFDQLEKFIEASIDEYKMEQDYQIFIQTLRDFLRGRRALKRELHIVLGDSICFFDHNLHEMKRREIIKMIDRKLVGNHPVYIDSVTIAPLLSIAPKIINLYTDEPEQPIIRTIQNIFEERIHVKSVSAFLDMKTSYSLAEEKI